jgi:hypothetical protein
MLATRLEHMISIYIGGTPVCDERHTSAKRGLVAEKKELPALGRINRCHESVGSEGCKVFGSKKEGSDVRSRPVKEISMSGSYQY